MASVKHGTSEFSMVVLILRGIVGMSTLIKLGVRSGDGIVVSMINKTTTTATLAARISLENLGDFLLHSFRDLVIRPFVIISN